MVWNCIQFTENMLWDFQIIILFLLLDVESTDKHDSEEVKNENVDMTEKQIDKYGLIVSM